MHRHKKVNFTNEIVFIFECHNVSASGNVHLEHTLPWVRHFLFLRTPFLTDPLVGASLFAISATMYQRFRPSKTLVSKFFAIYNGCAHCIESLRYLQWVRSACQHFTLFTVGAPSVSHFNAIYNGCAQRVNILRYLQWVRSLHQKFALFTMCALRVSTF